MDKKMLPKKDDMFFIAVMAIVFVLSFYNYLLFHSLVEVMSIIVSVLVFVIVMNSRKQLDNSFIKILGAAYLFIAILDLMHTFSYHGLNIFPQSTANLPTQLWLMARYMESLSLLLAFVLYNKKISFSLIVASYTVLTTAMLFVIFYLKAFPAAYIEGRGLTDFKIYSEYAISLIFFTSLVLLFYNRKKFKRSIFYLLNYAIVFSIISELIFTLYVSVYDVMNGLGHLFKLVSVYFVYKAVVDEGITRPQNILFHNLKQNEERLKESEKKYIDLFGHMGSGFALHKVIVDIHGKPVDFKFIEANQAFGDMMGLDTENMIGKRVTEVFPGIENDEEDWIGKYGRVALLGGSKKYEQYFEGLEKWFFISAYQPRPGYFATILEDITERKKKEKDKTEFIYFVSHELKTPLASQRLSLELLDKSIAGKSDSETGEYLDNIKETNLKMQAFIEELLDVSSIESGNSLMNKEPLDAGIQVRSIIRGIKPMASERNLELISEIATDLPVLLMDEKIFYLIMNNLISNALRYSHPGGSVTVTVNKTQKSVLIGVSDDGRGIPKKEQPKIFDKMYRANNSAKSGIKGSGLGLYIVHSLIKKIEAVIRLESEEGKGTTFYIEFPLSKFSPDL